MLLGLTYNRYPITVEHDALVVQPITSCSPTTQALAEKLVLERFLNSWVLTYISPFSFRALLPSRCPASMAFMPSRNSSIRLLSRFTYSPTPSRITVGWVSSASHSLSAGGSLAWVHGEGCRDTFGHGTRRWQAARKAAGADPGTGRVPSCCMGYLATALVGSNSTIRGNGLAQSVHDFQG